MIHRSSFSGFSFRPPQASQRIAAAPRRQMTDSVQFGWGDFYYGSYVKLDVEADYFSGFTPGMTLQEMFHMPGSVAATVIDRPERLEQIWSVLGLEGFDKPKVDWKSEVVVLVAQERSDRNDATPTAMTYNRYSDQLDIRLKGQKKEGRYSGAAWYLGKVQNGAAEKPGYRPEDRNKLTAQSRISTRVYD